jgi:hypothetical protein
MLSPSATVRTRTLKELSRSLSFSQSEVQYCSRICGFVFYRGNPLAYVSEVIVSLLANCYKVPKSIGHPLTNLDAVRGAGCPLKI